MMAPPTTSFCASYSTARWAWTDENGLDYVSDACHSSRRALSLVASYLEGQGG